MTRSFVFALLLAPLAAQSVTVPAANAAARGTGGLNTVTRGTANPRTYMLGVAASHLAGIPVGSYIHGISFRDSITASNAATWPAVATTWSDYEIKIGPAIPIGTWTTTFANNFAAAPTMVHDGPVVVAPATFVNSSPTAPTPNPWAEFYFDFQTSYLYTGGDIAIYLTHPGSNNTTHVFLDTIPSAAASGYVAYSGTGMNVATGAVATFCIHRLHYGYGAGCPGSLGNPNLVLNDNTTGGGTMLFTIANAPPAILAVFGHGFGTTLLPVSPNCNVLVQPPLAMTFVLTDAFGRATQSIAIPSGILGSFHSQAGVFDVLAADGFCVSNGVTPTMF